MSSFLFDGSREFGFEECVHELLSMLDEIYLKAFPGFVETQTPTIIYELLSRPEIGIQWNPIVNSEWGEIAILFNQSDLFRTKNSYRIFYFVLTIRIHNAWLDWKNGEIENGWSSLLSSAMSISSFKAACDVGRENDQYAIAQQLLGRVMSGASKGGQRSAETRRSESRVPDGETLRAQRDVLLAEGKADRAIVGILAKRHNCTTDSIRKKLKRE